MSKIRGLINIKKKEIGLIVILLLIIGVSLFAGILIGMDIAPKQIVREKEIRYKTVKVEPKLEEKKVDMGVAAIDRAGQGVIGDLTVTVRKGTGLILVSINDVLAGYDTQYSARVAAQAASDYTMKSIENLDIIYSIKTDAPLVSGMSAGAAMSMATVAALEDRNLKEGVIMTGTIDEYGYIGAVGGVYEKALAAKENGLELFLVPLNQATGITYEKNEECRTRAGFNFCRINYEPIVVDISKEVGIYMVEVENIEEAAKYILK